MNNIKKYLGIVWFLLAPAVIYFLVAGAILHIDPAGKKDINNPVIWVIIIAIFTPIAIGLMILAGMRSKENMIIFPKVLPTCSE